MNPNTGDYYRLEPGEAPHLGDVLVTGTDEQVAELSRRVKLGARQLDNRKARRQQQRASRRRNR